MDNITWKDVYTRPFHNDDFCGIYVKDFNGQIAFNKCENNPELYNRILNKLNGLSEEKFNAEKQGCYIYVDDRRILLIRGWGRLTGAGMRCFHLDSNEASNIQDEFGKWVVETLNK